MNDKISNSPELVAMMPVVGKENKLELPKENGIANKEVEIGADYITIPVYKHEINLEKGTREVNGNVISNKDEKTRKRLNKKAMKSKGEVSKEENINTSVPKKRGRKPKANLGEKAE